MLANLNTSIVHRLTSLLNNAFIGLSVDISPVALTEMAILIHQTMDQQQRIYHTSQHIFDLCQDMNPRQTLAALFHDIVYYQLDNKEFNISAQFLAKLGKIENQQLFLQTNISNELPQKLCLPLFGFQAGDTIALSSGVNEFLSAILATTQLQAYLQPLDLLAVATCIEATVPFRGIDKAGLTFPEQLAERVKKVALAMDLSLSSAEHSALVCDAIELANRDVASFSSADHRQFLATSWQLLEENNAAQNTDENYSIQAYRNNLLNMDSFLRALKPERVFHTFQNSPEPTQFAALQQAAHRNISFAIQYFSIKITGIAILEALALLSGGDCAIATFLGQQDTTQTTPRAADYLPKIEICKPIDAELLAVLDKGHSQFSIAPFCAYLCRRMGQVAVLQASHKARQMFNKQLSPQNFLNYLESEIVYVIAEACARMMPTRTEALLKLADYRQAD